jgi:hypothetical protein
MSPEHVRPGAPRFVFVVSGHAEDNAKVGVMLGQAQEQEAEAEGAGKC